MAVMASVFDETQRATLEALCDTFVPTVETDTGDPVERDFLARSAGEADPEAKLGLTQLKGLTMLLFYGAPDESTG